MNNKSKILTALWFFQAVNYLDRVAISFAGPSIMKSLTMDPKAFGIILSSFAIGYLIAQVPGGMLADRFGNRLLMLLAPIGWAIATGLTGLVASVAAFVVVRGSLGIAEGLSNAPIYNLIGENFNSRERSRAVAIWGTAFALGPALTGPIVGFLLSHFRWQAVFQMIAIPALIAALAIYVFIPSRHRSQRASDAGDPKSGTPQQFGAEFKKVLRDPSLWVISAAYCAFNIAFWGYLGWMPSYLSSARGIDMRSIGMLGGIPYLSAFFGLLIFGWLGGSRLYRFRLQMLCVSYVVAAISLFGAYTAQSLSSSLVGLSLSALFMYGGLSCFGAILLDLAPEAVRGTYSGICSTVGQVGGAIAPALIGVLVSRSGTFAAGFGLMVAALCIAGLCMIALLPMMPIRARNPNSPDALQA